MGRRSRPLVFTDGVLVAAGAERDAVDAQEVQSDIRRGDIRSRSSRSLLIVPDRHPPSPLHEDLGALLQVTQQSLSELFSPDADPRPGTISFIISAATVGHKMIEIHVKLDDLNGFVFEKTGFLDGSSPRLPTPWI